MTSTNVTAHRKMPVEDRQFYFGMTAASLLSLAIVFLAGEII